MSIFIALVVLFIALVIAFKNDSHPIRKKVYSVFIKLLLTACVGVAFLIMVATATLGLYQYHVLVKGASIVAPVLFLLPIWFSKKRRLMGTIALGGCLLAFCLCIGNAFYLKYDNSLVVNTDVNINVQEYMPFDGRSKIVTLKNEASLQLESDLPIVDGAAAVFPVYSAFVNAVYPSTVQYQKAPFYYHNTSMGYEELAEKRTDIFFGAYPSKNQIEYARQHGTEFEYTEIGKEGFVFFVNKKNPVDSLTIEQIKGIYSGKITNWKEVGGKNEPINAFQRREGSGSQSMLIRLMDNTPLMEAPTTQVVDFMSGIIDKVADYKNYSNSIGFSFRYYLDTLIANPDVKMIKINGIAPTKENIANGSYPIVTSLYAVTYKDNPNENVPKLLKWILSEEGQEIIDRTGYVAIK